MASLFEQYEQSATNVSSFIASVSGANQYELSSQNSIINIRSDNDVPIFKKHKIDFSPPDAITHLLVCNNQLIMTLRRKILLKIDLMHPQQPIEIDLTRSLGEKSNLSRIYQLFLDPSGKHCIISLLSTDTQLGYENLYYSKKVQPLVKTKGHILSAVGWNYANCLTNSNSTSNILIGTTKGLIFETELTDDSSNKFFSIGNTEQYWKQVFDLGFDAGIVTAIEFHKSPHNVSTDPMYFIIVTTKNRLYQLIGNVPNAAEPPLLHHVFNTYSGQFQDMPGNLGFSKLDFYYNRYYSIPKSFGWLTEPGILYGQIDFTLNSSNSVINDSNLISYEKDDNYIVSSSIEKPISMVITEFHVMILFKNRLKAICALNEEIVFEDFFTETYGNTIGIVKDPAKGTVWVYSETAVYRYKIVDEERNIWKVYLSKGDFDNAKHFAKNDPIKLDKVICDEAMHYFSIKNYEKSASLYALSQKSFEEIALKFLQIGEDEALKQFLVCKMDTLNSEDVTQITMLLLWLIEIILNQMGSLKNAEKQSTEEYSLLDAEFKSILTQEKIKNCLIQSKKTIYALIASHGHESNLIYFALLMHDYDIVLKQYLQHKKYKEALHLLHQKGIPDLFYTFSPAIMQEMPHELISVLIEFAPKLDSAKLIPTLVTHQHGDAKQGLETIRYLEYCAYKLSDSDAVIHNYLLALYAQMEPDKLITYLSMKGHDESSVPYDLKYALRICSELGLGLACVHLYSTMGMYEEAVDLALTIDVELAKQNADKLDSNEELRKKLWLKIAQHVVMKENDVKKATKFLQECELLKIEDILPFFPDFITIDHFKEAICSSLNEYNRHIENLKEDMKLATESASEIREEIKAFRNKYTIVHTHDKCIVCNYAVLTRAFHVFPCGHMFHSDCLMSEVIPHLDQASKDRIEEIKRQLAIHQLQQNKVGSDFLANSTNSIVLTNNREKLLSESDDIVASECIYCGDIMIKSIDQPFKLSEESGLDMEGWD